MSKTKQFIAILLAVVTILTVISSAFFAAQNPLDDEYENVKALARTQMWVTINNGLASSGSIAIMDGGKIVYSEGFAMADRQKSIPVTADTQFNIGSISKTFCAVAVMLLVDDGKLNLDHPVAEYLPTFNMSDPRFQNITVRMLLDHTNGIPGTVWTNSVGYQLNPNFYSDVLNQLSVSYLKAAPGEMGPYSNDGYNLAEILVARVSGTTYLDFLSQRIFKPLGLDNTGSSVGLQPSEKIAAYHQLSTGTKVPPEVLSVMGAGGLASTAEDLVRFADSLSFGGNHLLRDSSIAEMTKPQLSQFAKHSIEQTGINPEFYYGLGLDIASLPSYQEIGLKLIGKGGDTEDYHSMLLSAPGQRISVAVIQAGHGNTAPKIAVNLLNAVLQQKRFTPPTTSASASLEQIPAQYSVYEGVYAPHYHVSFNFKANTCLIANLNPKEAPLVLTYGGNCFYASDGSTKFEFITVDDQNYFVVSCIGNLLYLTYGQQLPTLDTPYNLSVDLNGMQWLRRNIAPYEQTPPSILPPHITTSNLIADLHGYVNFNGIKVVTSPTYAAVSAGAIRDQSDLTLIDCDGQTWAKVYECIYSPAYLATQLKSGVNTATIGSNGYNEWFVAANDCLLTFQPPAGGRIIVFTPDGTPMYDSALASGPVSVVRGCFVEVAGVPGDVFNVIAS